MNPYTSTWSGVTPGDGPQEVHVVLLDNGRTRALADEVGRQALRCIRCSACLNVVPGLRAGRWARLRLGLPGPDRRHPQPAAQGGRARPAGRLAALRLDAVRRVRRRLPGRHRHPRHPGAPAHQGRRRPPRRHRAQGRGAGHAGRLLGHGGCRPDGPGRARRRRGRSPRPRAGGCRVVAARCRGCRGPGRAGPRPATCPCRRPSRSAPGGAGSAATRCSDERPRRRARRRARRPGAGP